MLPDGLKKALEKRELWVIVILAGVFLVLLCNLAEKRAEDTERKETNGMEMSNKEDNSYDTFGISQNESGEKVYRGQGSFWNTGTWEDWERGYQDTDISGFCQYWEDRLQEVLSRMKGVGETEVVLYAREDENHQPGITGVFVLAQGAEQEAVEVRIRKALGTLLGISDHQISVQILSFPAAGTKGNKP